METKLLQRLKIISKSNFLSSGYLFILALLAIAISLLVLQRISWQAALFSLVVIAYLLGLLICHYPQLKKVSLLMLVLFTSYCVLRAQSHPINLTNEKQLILYSDRVKITAGYLSGQGSYAGQKVLIAGKVDSRILKLLQAGKTVVSDQVTGKTEKIMPATNPGEFDFRKYYDAKGIQERITIERLRPVTFQNNLSSKLHYFRFRLQQYFKKMPKLLGFFSSELILAENPLFEDQEILDNYRNLGIIHLLSISGLHVSIYVLAFSTLLYWLKIDEKKTAIACCLLLILGIILSNQQVGFVRASLCYFLTNLFKFKRLKISSFDLLGLTCLIHLILLPKLFLNSGSILSYTLVLGLHLTQNFSKIGSSFLLNLLITPFLLFYFFQTNLLTVILNFLAIPYFNFVVLPLTFLNLLLSWFLPKCSLIFEKILSITEKLIAILSQTKLGLVSYGKLKWWQCIFLFLLTLLILANLEKEKLNFKQVKIKKTVCLLGASYLIFYLSIHCPLSGQVSFIDVGQGDSILITTPFPRKTYLIDTGGKLNFSGHQSTPQVKRITIPLLKAQGINQIDGLFVSHQDADHVGDVKPLMEEIPVKKLYLAKGLLNNPSFQKRVAGQARKTEFVQLLAGMQVKEPQITFNVVYPFKAGDGKNEDSLSLAFRLAGYNWLFTGDLGQEGEQELVEKFPLKIDYFKLGHHGSKTASNPDFLKKISPQLVFISAGRNNRFGHPHPETLRTLKEQQIPWVSTQDCGMISWYYGIRKPHFERFLREKIE